MPEHWRGSVIRQCELNIDEAEVAWVCEGRENKDLPLIVSTKHFENRNCNMTFVIQCSEVFISCYSLGSSYHLL
jgi:hypothetical protein